MNYHHSLNETIHPNQTLILRYHERWEHELLNDEQKPRQAPRRPRQPIHLHSETPARVVQELLSLSLAHFVIRKTMFAAAVQYPVDPDRRRPRPPPLLCRNRFNPRVIKRGRNQWPGKKPIHSGLAKLQNTLAESLLIHRGSGIGPRPAALRRSTVNPPHAAFSPTLVTHCWINSPTCTFSAWPS